MGWLLIIIITALNTVLLLAILVGIKILLLPLGQNYYCNIIGQSKFGQFGIQ